MSFWRVASFYWNAALSVIALVIHGFAFAAHGITGNPSFLFPLVPISMLMFAFSMLAMAIHAVILCGAFVRSSSVRYHRLWALMISLTACVVWLVSGRMLGWFLIVWGMF